MVLWGREVKVKLVFLPAAALTVLAGPAYSTVYLTIEGAQARLFPGATFQPEFRTLTAEQVKEIEKRSGVPVRNKDLKAWRASTGGWLIADQVVGKHDFIPFALALDEGGSVKGVEILEYREAYGGQIRQSDWRQQFVHRPANEKLQLGKQIRNISGATLSCRHMTDGVTRLLATYSVALRNDAGSKA